MRPKLALAIGGSLALLFGLGLTFAPDAMMASFGLTPDVAGRVLSRDFGVSLVAVGVLNLLARKAAPGPALDAILWGNLLVQVFSVVVDGYHVASGQISASGIGGIVLHAVLGVMFLLALLRPEKAF